MEKFKSLLILLGTLGLLLTACQPKEPVVEFLYGETAIVESVDVLLLEIFPVQARAVISGQLPDGCTELNGLFVTRDDQTFEVTVNTRRPTGGVVCTQALVPFEETVALDVEGLEAGTYTVIVQDQEVTFTLDADNVLD